MHGCGESRGHGRMGGKLAMIMAMRGGGRGGWDGDRWGEDETGGRGGRSGPGGRGRRRMFAGGELRLLLLRLIVGQPKAHGYELIKEIEELTGGEYAPSPGVVYPTLSLLVDEGRIEESADAEGSRKAFSATPEGIAEVHDREAEATALIDRLKALAAADRAGSLPVRRAIANLFVALRHRAAASGFDTDTAHAIADILDEAARRIERL